MRRFGRPGPKSILNPPLHEPTLDRATGTQFVLLADLPERELVLGAIVIAPPGSQQDQSPTPEEFKRPAPSRVCRGGDLEPIGA